MGSGYLGIFFVDGFGVMVLFDGECDFVLSFDFEMGVELWCFDFGLMIVGFVGFKDGFILMLVVGGGCVFFVSIVG